MAHKKSASQASTPQKSSTPVPPPSKGPAAHASSSTPSKPLSTLSPKAPPQDVALHVWNQYVHHTPSRTLLLDAFMAFLVLVGGIQFIYAVVGGNYPFNAFLSGFSAAVGQFVLTASLRMQTSERAPAGVPVTKKSTVKTVDGVTGEIIEEGKGGVSSERAFADYIFGSLILHGFCVNFIN